jgi:sugar transferase EpsL
MSLVGPRPLPDEYLPLYSSQQLRRHAVKPGLTGWAQINGRNSLSWEERFKLDIWYIENASFKLDVMILFKTAINLLDDKSINKSKDLTMDKFSGGSKN